MANYSRGDLQAMTVAFTHLFKVHETVAQSPLVQKWMQEAPEGIVEFDGTLKGERSKQRDTRMEMYEVYDGQITNLVSYLRSLRKEYKSLSKWELIFQIYNEIMDVQKVIEQAESQTIFSTSEEQNEVPQSGEELQTSQGTSIEEAPSQPASVNTQVTEDVVAPTPTEMHEDVTEQQQPVEESVSESISPAMASNVESQQTSEPMSSEEVGSHSDEPIIEEPSSDVHTAPTNHVEESVVSNVGTTVEEKVADDAPVVEEVKEQRENPTPTSFKNGSVAVDEVQSTLRDEVLNRPVAEMGDASRSGNVQSQNGNPLFNNNKYMEEMNMAENAVDQLLKAAEGAAGANPAEVQRVPESNVGAAKTDVKEAQQKVSNILGGEKDTRLAWTRSNVVTNLISTMRPAALRMLSDMGTVGTQTDANKRAEAIANKVTGYVQLVSGRKGLNVDQFEALTDTEKWANVVPGETKVNDIPVSNLDKAKAIYELLKQVKQNPTMEVPAFVPANPSFPTKGYFIGSVPYSTDEFMVELVDNSNGAIYGEDSITADGQEKEDAVFFRLGIAKKTEKAQAQAITTQKVEKKVPVVRAKNKKKFVEGEKHVVYLFNTVDQEGQGKAAFRAAINVNGALVAAGVAVYSLDDQGKKIVLSHDNKNNKDRYKTRQASVSVTVPVTKILKEFAPEFKGEDEAVIAAARWNVNMGSGKAQGNFGQIMEFSQTPVFDVFTQVYAGQMAVTGSMKGSKSLSALKAAADQQASEDAAAAAGELA